jgi:hypothetical protein
MGLPQLGVKYTMEELLRTVNMLRAESKRIAHPHI